MQRIAVAEKVQFDITIDDLAHLMDDVSDKEHFSIKLKQWSEGYTPNNIEIRKY